MTKALEESDLSVFPHYFYAMLYWAVSIQNFVLKDCHGQSKSGAHWIVSNS